MIDIINFVGNHLEAIEIKSQKPVWWRRDVYTRTFHVPKNFHWHWSEGLLILYSQANVLKIIGEIINAISDGSIIENGKPPLEKLSPVISDVTERYHFKIGEGVDQGRLDTFKTFHR